MRPEANASDAAELAEDWLARAYELVEYGWCQGASATDASGRRIAAESSLARAWSAPGALLRAWRESAEDDDPLGIAAFARANLALTAAVGEIPAIWNDAPDRRQHVVLEAVLAAVSLVRTARGRWAQPREQRAAARQSTSSTGPPARLGLALNHTCSPAACACDETGDRGVGGSTASRRPGSTESAPSSKGFGPRGASAVRVAAAIATAR